MVLNSFQVQHNNHKFLSLGNIHRAVLHSCTVDEATSTKLQVFNTEVTICCQGRLN